MSDIQRSFSDPKVEKSKWKAIMYSYRAKYFEALPSNPLLPSNSISKGSFTNYSTHEAQTLAIENKRGIRGHNKLRL